MDMQEIEVVYVSPTAKEFVDLRAAAGMPGRTVSSAEKGISNSLFWITLRMKQCIPEDTIRLYTKLKED